MRFTLRGSSPAHLPGAGLVRGLTDVLRQLGAATGAAGWEADTVKHHSQHRQVAPKLESIDMTLRWDPEGRISLHAAGRSPLKRTNLWTLDEVWAEDNPVYGPYDAVSHLVLVCAQDRPNTKERLFFSMNGGLGWADQELPFPPS